MSSLRVLIVEDRPADAELMARYLQEAGLDILWDRVATEPAFLARLEQPYDVILADYSLPQFNGIRALDLVKERGLAIPFVLVSGALGEEQAVEAIKRGATDYVLKDRPLRLGTAVKQALEQKRLDEERRRAEARRHQTEEELRRLNEQLEQRVVDRTAQLEELNAALRESEIMYRALVEQIPAITYTITLEGTGSTTFISPQVETLLGYAVDEYLKCPDCRIEWVHPEDRNRVLEQITYSRDTGQPFRGEYRVRARGGREVWVRDQASVIRDGDGQPLFLQGVMFDITERKQAEERLKYLSTHDTLTGLYNRAFFEEELARLERSREFPVSVLIADVDGLKATNDRLGHAAGDELLKRVAALLKKTFRAADVISRLGGDEFALLLPETDQATLARLIERVKNRESHDQLAVSELPVRLSIGSSTAEMGHFIRDALRQADEAMYADKLAHKAAPETVHSAVTQLDRESVSGATPWKGTILDPQDRDPGEKAA